MNGDPSAARYEERLRASEERYRALTEASTDVITRFDGDGVIVFVSPSARHVFGWDPDEVVGREFTELVHHDDLLQPPAVQKVEGGEQLRQRTMRVARRDGSWAWCDVVSRTVTDPVTGASEIQSSLRDATDRVEAERRLRETEERFRLSFERSPIGKALVGLDGRFLSVNQALCEIVGYSVEELTARTFQDITHPDDLDTDLAFVEQLLTGEMSDYEMEKRYRRSDGRIVWVQLNGSMLRSDSGEPMYFLAQIQDITARRSQALALVAANEELAAANELKDRFVANVSHELRTPLTVILGFGAAMADPATRSNPELLELATDAINRQARRLDRLVQDLLTLSKLEGGVSLAPEEVLLGPALRTILDESAARRERWILDVPETLTTHADPDRLAQIVANLVANAERHGAAPFEIDAAPSGAAHVTITVADSGPGVEPSFAPYLFERFAQAGGDSGGSGTGLGLAIARGLARAHGGDVWYEPNEPNGSMFVVSLPAGDNVAVEGDRAPAERGCILLAEDDPDMLAFLRIELEASGYAVVPAADGAAALTAARDHPPDLVLVDVVMPQLSGFDLLKQLRSTPSLAAVPVLVLTARALPADAASAVDLGASDFLSKPVEMTELLARIRAALETARVQAALRIRNRHLDAMNRSDPLTGLPNRRQIEDEHARLRARRLRRGGEYTVLVVDVDGLGQINAEHGPAAGDAVLRGVAGCLTASVRSEDVVGRVGGDEFVVLLPSGAAGAAGRTAARVRDAVAHLSVPGLPVPVSVSVVSASSSEHPDPLAAVDACMFGATASADC